MGRDYNNGHVHIPCTYLEWEDITNFQLTVNGNVHGPIIKNSKEAHWHLCKILHLNDKESLPFSYDEYKDSYKIPGTEDSQLKILPLETRAELSVNITFDTEQGVNLQTYHIGFCKSPIFIVLLLKEKK